jgi:hypothetical protein
MLISIVITGLLAVLGHGQLAGEVKAPVPVRIYAIGYGVSAPEMIPAAVESTSHNTPKTKHQATMTVHLFIDSAGRPQQIHVVRSIGGGRDEAALIRLASSRFKPATLDGQPVAVGTTMELSFAFRCKPRQKLTSPSTRGENVEIVGASKFLDWPDKPDTAVLGPIPVCRGTL